MADDALNSHLLLIDLSDSEPSEPEEAANPSTTTPTPELTRAERTALTEPAFQALKKSYRAKVENGEIWLTIPLPLVTKLSKPDAQELLHAVEELYFFRRYDEAVEFLSKVFDDGKGEECIDQETRELLRGYEERCRTKFGNGGTKN
ncbi:hypothetical protein QBC38DRAFT_471916 [Podospora fimiseda]|uniref:Uncharacterized protein n=1 Tax=Podospora fimiseda TaxID=252190 RepID=A0AAN7BUL7_9PEZI|nr:hypothetical protein QBC38DRAFT_471916 [Podospora fimiseda]